ncbi:MAG: efflux RND transporter permease subunit [Chloroflexi bacterium]|nr:efflux RND transporter permease subunit [Chloroflexota bacterium]
MRSIITICLQFRFLVVILAAVVMFLGITQMRTMPVDVLPEFSPPYVEIQTEALGLSAEEVEELIAVPLEQDLLNGVAWLDTIRSESVPGLSSVTLIFEPGTDLYRARQMVNERLSQAAVGLPHVSKSPVMLQPTSATSRVLIVGLSSKSLSMIQMSVLARWTIAPRLMGVPDVANVAIWGLRDRQLQVQVDPERLRAHDIPLLQVLETTGNALWVSSLSFVEASTPGNAGFIDTPQQRLGIQHILPILSPEGLAQVPITRTVRLIDVANVVEDHQPLIGDALTNNGTSLLLVIEKFPGSNTVKVTRGVEDALEALRPGLGGVNIDSTIFRPASFIEMAMDNLARTFIIGIVLVVLALGVLFFNWRTALISFVTIPLSLTAAGLVLYLRNATLNVMVLAGLVIALGIVVDDAIVGVESIARRLRQPRKEDSGKSPVRVILEASVETRSTLFFATLICLLAVLPVLALDGLAGAFFYPLALSYVLAVLAAMVVALTVTPVLSAILLPGMSKLPSLTERWGEEYAGWVKRVLQGPRWVFLSAVVLTAIAIAVLPFLGQSLLPMFKESDLRIHLEAAPGTSLPAMTRMVNQMTGELRAIPGIRNMGTTVGRAIFGDQVVGINSAEIWLSIDSKVDYAGTIDAINQTIARYGGFQSDVQTYLGQTSSAIVAGPSDPIAVRLYGQDWAVLRREAEQVKQSLAGIAGIVEEQLKLPIEEAILEVEVDLAAAQRYGIKPGDVRRTAATLLNGLQVGSLFEEQKVFDVVVWSTPETRRSVNSVGELLIDMPDGGRVRLADVAHVRIKSAPTVVKHDNVSRYLDIGLTVRGRDFGAVMGDVQARLRQSRFPLEYHAEVLGNYAQQQDTQNRLLSFAAVALIGMFLLLHASFTSWRLALASVLSLAVALAGGVLAVGATGVMLTLGSLVGLLAVFGIAARNQIMLLKHYEHLAWEGGEAFGPELILRGARERLAPILMTALTMSLALLPVLFLGDIPGLEVLRPMAVVILGGLVTTTLVNLFVVPAVYWTFGANLKPDTEMVGLMAMPSTEPQIM